MHGADQDGPKKLKDSHFTKFPVKPAKRGRFLFMTLYARLVAVNIVMMTVVMRVGQILPFPNLCRNLICPLDYSAQGQAPKNNEHQGNTQLHRKSDPRRDDYPEEDH